MKLICITIVATFAATTVFAGGYTPLGEEPQPVVGPIPSVEADGSWTGGYAGLQYGKSDLNLKRPAFKSGLVTTPEASISVDTDGYGAHGGYLHDFGNYVLGGELDYNIIKAAKDHDSSDLWRLRGRAGYDFGRWLPYATLGAAHVSEGDVSETGVSYGIGIDFKVTEQFTFGAEYNRQSFNIPLSDIGLHAVGDAKADLELMQIRGAYHF